MASAFRRPTGGRADNPPHARSDTDAKKKQMDIVKPEDLGVDVKPRLKTLKVVEPPKRSAGIKVPDVATLVAKLKNEAKVMR